MPVATSVGPEYSGLENFTKKKGGGEKEPFCSSKLQVTRTKDASVTCNRKSCVYLGGFHWIGSANERMGRMSEDYDIIQFFPGMN
jgi:hypothetical protein